LRSAQLEHPIPNPAVCVHGECHLAEIRVDPLAVANLDLFARQPYLGGGLAREGVWRRSVHSIRSQVASLKPPGRQPPDSAKAPLASHHATLALLAECTVNIHVARSV